MSDWQKGDLALCVRTPRGWQANDPHPCRVGQVYTVGRVVHDPNGILGLGLKGVTFPNCGLNADSASNYLKVTPPAHMKAEPRAVPEEAVV